VIAPRQGNRRRYLLPSLKMRPSLSLPPRMCGPGRQGRPGKQGSAGFDTADTRSTGTGACGNQSDTGDRPQGAAQPYGSWRLYGYQPPCLRCFTACRTADPRIDSGLCGRLQGGPPVHRHQSDARHCGCPSA
jgi:hypothetical protein